MKNDIINFLSIDDNNVKKIFLKSSLLKIKINKKDKKVIFIYNIDDFLSEKEIELIFNLENNIYIDDYSVEFIFNIKNKYNKEKFLNYFISIIKIKIKELSDIFILNILSCSEIFIEKEFIYIYILNNKVYNKILKLNIDDTINKINEKFSINKKIKFFIKNIKNIDNKENNFKILNKNINNKNINNKNINNIDSVNIKKIKDIVEEDKIISIEAEIFHKEIKKINSNKYLLILKVTDYTESIIIKKWLNSSINNEFNIGEWYLFNGEVKLSYFKKNILEIFIKNEKKLNKKSFIDNEKNKRIELHSHTKMSQLDGVVDVTKLIDTAKEMGHKAVAITDHSVLHSFPQAYLYTKNKKNFPKVIYGCELNVYNDINTNILVQELDNNYKIGDITYIVFDLETTGLSANNNEIIEIAAIKIKNEKIIDKYEKLIKPKEKITDFISELTNITQEELNKNKTILETFPEFLNWCGDFKKTIFVAHNAKFDINFLKSCYYKLYKNNLKINYLDTLQLSKYLYPELKRYGLKYIAKHLRINLVLHHRAIYDTETTAKIFLNMYQYFLNNNIVYCKDINKIINHEILHKVCFPYHLTVLVKNKIGLKNLYKIVSMSHIKYFHKQALVPKSLLIELKEGLLIGSACLNNEIFSSFLNESEENLIKKLNFYDYIEVQPPSNYYHLIDLNIFDNVESLNIALNKFINILEKENKTVVATGDVHILKKEDNIFRKIYIDSQKGMHPLSRKEIKNIPPTPFLTTEKMKEKFKFLNDEALINKIVVFNTHKIEKEIEDIEIIPDKLFTPKMENVEEKILDIVNNRIKKLYGDIPPDIITKRINKELEAIIKHKFSVIYYICHKIVKKSLKDGYIVGSRGSVGSSFIAYLMEITEVNPLIAHYLCEKCKKCIFNEKYASGFDMPDKKCENCGNNMKKNGHNIPFETFLGFNGDKVPDIDLNFSGEYQSKAHDYTKDLFGEENVFRAGTITTIANKTAYGYVKNYLSEKYLFFSDTEIDRIVLNITGVKKTNGRHSGGIIIVPNYMDIYDISPVQYPADGKTGKEWKITHFDFVSIHDNLLKLDLLGHDDPTIIRMLEDITNISPYNIPLDDKKVYSLFTTVKHLNFKYVCDIKLGSLGIPEFGTEFVRNMLLKTKPKNFSELVQISGLSHGTDVWLNNAQELVDSKKCTLKEVIGCRDDIMVNLIKKGIDSQIAFSIMELTRKGKFLKDNKYINVLRDKKVPEWYINSCIKIKYMFPKAHAVAYVISAIRIAWFKIYKPLEFYASIFSIRYKNKSFDIPIILKGIESVKKKLDCIKLLENKTTRDYENISLLELIYEMLARGFKFKNVDLYKSHETNFIVEDDYLIFPFQSVEGLGESISKSIVIERKKNTFLSKEDFKNRVTITQTVFNKLEELKVLNDLEASNQLSLFKI